MPLDINRSVELANHYLGFNRWSSNILSLNQEFLEYGDSFKCCYNCRVAYQFPDGRIVEAEGRATYSASDKKVAIELAKKHAITDARKNGFQQIVLIELEDGRTAVHILGQCLDDHWQTEKVQVKEEKVEIPRPSGNLSEYLDMNELRELSKAFGF
eukprot:TRINITY_DN9988_c0_g1_i1.p2 TRINITY_DN9988_c0_g1~~TRINITY_DN9988_c0_g1_i1.p2  ORF type:complete len:156 (-),score=45.71 TRINITY_DN9988_c0_g1_i1:497-964(-)